MHSDKLRRTVTFLSLAFVLAVPSFAATKRRAANHPAAGGQLTADITGTVLDNGTGQPISSVRVKVGRESDTTDAAGKFDLKTVTGFNGSINVEVTRSGYTSKTVRLTTGGKQDLTIRLDPTPTVRVRKVDGTTYDIDFDSAEFGYAVTFSGYRSDTFEDFCKADGTSIAVDRTQLRRITGPAVTATGSACCPNTAAVKVNIELKTGEKTDVVFLDACNGYPNIDFLGRDHTTGKFQYIPFHDIAEITFP
jgi:hypothetical protein